MTSQIGNVDLMATADVVAMLGLSNSTIIRMVDDGKLSPAFKAPGIRGAYFFNRSEIEAMAKGDAK